MSENKKYYWLKLKDDFFEDDTIQFIEEQKNGILYVNFYLKLCLKSLKTEGNLIRLVGENFIPYDIESLSRLTNTPVDTVRVAMELFKKIGIVKIQETGEIYMAQIKEMIGSETDKAEIMRRKRAVDKLSSNNVTQMLPERYPEIEIEKEKEKEIDIELKKEIELDLKKDKKKTKENEEVEEIKNIYNQYCTNLSEVQKITDKRKIAIKKFLKEYSIDDFRNICIKANNTDFLIGKNDRKWKADFDFLLKVDKATAILENKYTISKKDKIDGWLDLYKQAKEEEQNDKK